MVAMRTVCDALERIYNTQSTAAPENGQSDRHGSGTASLPEGQEDSATKYLAFAHSRL